MRDLIVVFIFQTLLEHYISMTDPMRAESVDTELTRHCAYSLPAVALTLGRQNWPVLKDTYETLAGDMHVSFEWVSFCCDKVVVPVTGM